MPADAKTAEPANPREAIGGNNPPLAKTISEQENFAQTVTDYLGEEFKDAIRIAEELLEEARALPKEIDDDETKGKFTSLIKRIRDHAKKLDAFHESEGTNYMRGKQAVDQFFFGPIDKLARRDKKNRPGAADVLNARLTDYDTKVLAAKQAELKRQADEADRVAREKADQEAEAARIAEETRLSAERARSPGKIEEKREAADEAARTLTTASAEAQVAAGAAETAHVDSLAKPADLMRARGDDGTLSTMVTEPYAILVDRTKLDFAKIAPFFTLIEIEKALRQWAKNTGYTVQMDGASIGRKPKSVVR